MEIIAFKGLYIEKMLSTAFIVEKHITKTESDQTVKVSLLGMNYLKQDVNDYRTMLIMVRIDGFIATI